MAHQENLVFEFMTTTLSLSEKLLAEINQQLAPAGYEAIELELDLRKRQLRLYIDRLLTASDAVSDPLASAASMGVGIEDCVKVNHLLDEPLEQSPWIQEAFGEAGYELEVSSPGIDRPIRTEKDFKRFSGRTVRIQLERALTGEELQNPDYAEKNPKQKKYLGEVLGVKESKVLLSVNLTGGFDPDQLKRKSQSKKKKSTDATPTPTSIEADVVVQIPLSLITQANLEPDFEPLNEKVRIP